MKINVNLQPLNNWGTGICLFGNKLVEQLQQSKHIELFGCFNFVRGVKKHDLDRFTFPVKYSKFPYKLVYSRLVQTSLPFYYHHMMERRADFNLFFTYKIPRVKYKGITICTIHDLIPLKVPQENTQIEVDYKSDIVYAMGNCDYIITVSNASKSDIISEFGYPEDKIFVVPNGVDYSRFNEYISNEILSFVQAKYQLPKKFILYFGNIRKHKNVDSLIKAYALLPNNIREEFSLVIIKGNERLHNLVDELGITKQVHFTKFIDEEDIPSIYKLATAMGFISLYEGFGLPIIEAMAAGTPVITSNISSMLEVAGDAAILVDPLDLKQIANAMLLVIEDVELCSRMVASGFENAKKYSWENSGDKLKSVLEHLSQKVN